jgi:hypothetical protein
MSNSDRVCAEILSKAFDAAMRRCQNNGISPYEAVTSFNLLGVKLVMGVLFGGINDPEMKKQLTLEFYSKAVDARLNMESKKQEQPND